MYKRQGVENTGNTNTQPNSNLTNAVNQQNANINATLFNPFGGVNTQTALFKLGQSLRSEPSTANTVRGVSSGLKSLFSIGRTVAAGAGFANLNRQILADNAAQVRQGIVGNGQLVSAREGGLIQFLRNGGSIDTISGLSEEKALTGAYMTGLPEKTDITPNAEIETKEYVKHPNGDVQKVVGKTHEKGGEKVNLDEGTKIVSNHLEVGGDLAKELTKDYDIKIKAKDTYAKVIDKYQSKIGLTKLNDEQESLFKRLKKEQDTEDITTKNLNNQFLSEKINEIEKKKEPLLSLLSEFTEKVFIEQEESKPAEEQGELQQFNNGGLFSSKEFKSLLSKYNLSQDQAIGIINKFKKGGFKFNTGGTTEDNTEATAKLAANSFNTSDLSPRQRQRLATFTNSRVSGNVNSEEELLKRMEELVRQNPVVATEAFNIRFDENGKLEFDLEEANIRAFQQGFTDNFNRLNEFVSNSEDFTDTDKQLISNSLNNEIFLQGDVDNARDFDGIFGNFTSSRPGAVFNIVTPEDLEKLNDEGITSYKQLLDPIGNIKKDLNLSPTSIQALDKFKGSDADFLLDEFDVTETPEPKAEETVTEEEITRQGLGLPLLPDQSVLPPDPLQPETKINRTFERLDPVRITNEENIKEINRQEQFVAEQLNQVPDSQRRAALANLTATSQDSINQSTTQVNIANAQNQQQTDQFNIGQSNLEENARASDTLNFEARALTGLAKTREDLANFFDFNRQTALGNFNTVNRLNLLNQLTENFNTDGTNIVTTNNNAPLFSTPNIGFAGLTNS